MKSIFAVEDSGQFAEYRCFDESHRDSIEAYLKYLKETYAVTDLPRAILWTSADIATKAISDIPIPAYTNDYRTVFCPDLNSWREIYLRQLDGFPDCDDVRRIRQYYESQLTDHHILQILGHEFVHHSNFFPDDDYAYGIWFEEGMCEYISRKYFLTDREFQEEAEINEILVNLFSENRGWHPLENFGMETYLADYSGIFFEYWRSFLAVSKIADQYNGNLFLVFRHYQSWLDSDRSIPLNQWFAI